MFRRIHRLAVACAAIVLFGCSKPPEAAPTPAGFHRIDAVGPFSVAIPDGLTRLPVIGVDTEVDEFVGDGLRLGLSHGSYGSVPPPQVGLIDHSTGDLEVDGRSGTWAAYERSADQVADGLPHAWIGAVRAPPRRGAAPAEPVGLTIYLSCRTKQICEIGPKVAATVRFGR